MQCQLHAHLEHALMLICLVPIGHMHIILEASCIIGHMHSCWIQAFHIDCICWVLQTERMELCALGGDGGGDRGGPAYN